MSEKARGSFEAAYSDLLRGLDGRPDPGGPFRDEPGTRRLQGMALLDHTACGHTMWIFRAFTMKRTGAQ